MEYHAEKFEISKEYNGQTEDVSLRVNYKLPSRIQLSFYIVTIATAFWLINN